MSAPPADPRVLVVDDDHDVADSLSLLYAAAAIGGTGAGAVYGTCVGSALKWFPDRRGLAVGQEQPLRRLRQAAQPSHEARPVRVRREPLQPFDPRLDRAGLAVDPHLRVPVEDLAAQRVVRLEAGDSMTFDPEIPHMFLNPTDSTTTVVVAISPPNI